MKIIKVNEELRRKATLLQSKIKKHKKENRRQISIRFVQDKITKYKQYSLDYIRL